MSRFKGCIDIFLLHLDIFAASCVIEIIIALSLVLIVHLVSGYVRADSLTGFDYSGLHSKVGGNHCDSMPIYF